MELETNVQDKLSQYLLFSLDELYAIEIKFVVEVLEYTKISKIPRTPDYMAGIINNRGKIVPIIDIRKQFGMEERKVNDDEMKKNKGVNISNIIILTLIHEGDELNLGILVDYVNEVLELNPSDIDDAPKLGTGFNSRFISGIGKNNNRFIIILNIENLFDIKDLSRFKNTTVHHSDYD
ncbi:Chemotaxis protein CheW [Borrelia miyamotoi]|uniref:Chemotaxis protein CheW n=1 Tax=Borrelia miyamotoi TaxID=47466 RepID=A0AAP8YUH1_9SPIR|nr:chemotaxis protein CheW [Borrelia miyamotoi]AHH04845.1 Chemotaxis protein cheW [Borrelia miyamotoi FR64b]ATQ14672.1 chemotaxis protein CheW [Borrelia miyamotoi]ATQ15856.1 chemotaxis protein CheW [Borrelia miyamotoi]ATQ17000.1 chemotaxis protein CheW [Borrelia miyamotoi]ATQ18495.1 chemotaxis protein CheW [Borrelia miyamotoi]